MPSTTEQSTVATESPNTRPQRDKGSVKTSPQQAKNIGIVEQRTRHVSYRRTVGRIQAALPYPSKVFSKALHTPIFENCVTLLACTIFRARPLLWGAVSGSFAGILTYILARELGYELSGSEVVIGFALGWLLGVTYDYFRLLFTGKK